MITVQRLRELLQQIPNEACANVYDDDEGKAGIRIEHPDGRVWFIRAAPDDEIDTETEGFA
ncbi:MAG: hypothetical protein ACPGJF_03395 [Sinimarinibacterium flocculans]|uniref:hypothetical protein n=1 Tax=Sinimarinibacterium flocculans TaxID=985250 RepID=UPI003C64DAEB